MQAVEKYHLCLEKLNSTLEQMDLSEACTEIGDWTYRPIFFYNDNLIDLVNIEAARYITANKTNDHLKLPIENKDILD